MTVFNAAFDTQGYIYVESYKEAHVREAIQGLRNIFAGKGAKLVPLTEMVDAVSVPKPSKALLGPRARLPRVRALSVQVGLRSGSDECLGRSLSHFARRIWAGLTPGASSFPARWPAPEHQPLNQC